MSKKSKNLIIFAVSFIIAFFIVGYIRNTMFVAIHWVEGVTAWDKFREYYIRTFTYNILPSFIIATLATFIANSLNIKRIMKLCIICIAILLLILLAVISYYIERTAALERSLKSFTEYKISKEQDYVTLQKETESIKNQLSELQKDSKLLVPDEIIKTHLDYKGFKGEIEDIAADLRKHPELIPYEGVLGGTMGYCSIKVLSDRWVFAVIEDGHIDGYMLLRYKWSGSSFDWKVVDSYLGGED